MGGRVNVILKVYKIIVAKSVHASLTLTDAFLPSFLFWRWAGCPHLAYWSIVELVMPFVDAHQGVH